MKNKELKKRARRTQRKIKVRSRISGTSTIPRVSVFKSNSHIYGQVIDDTKGATLLSDSGSKDDLKDKDIKDLGGKIKIAFASGLRLAEKMKEKKIEQAVFDRSGFRYHGRVKAFADGVRKGGIKI